MSHVLLGEPEPQYPTLPGYADGVTKLDPPTLQCRDCGTTATGPRVGMLVILSGFHFHRCEGRDGVRRCPDCLAKVEAACERRAHR